MVAFSTLVFGASVANALFDLNTNYVADSLKSLADFDEDDYREDELSAELGAPRDYRHDGFQKFATCADSGARQHTMAQSTITFDNACTDVMAEMKARASGDAGWQDPHNRGNYEVLSADDTMLKVKRRTGNNRYTDVITFAMQSTGDGCQVNACSVSQGNSNNDAGTNMCNMANLYCNSKTQADNGVACKPVNTELTYVAQTECGRYRVDRRYREHNCQPMANTCLRQPSLATAVVLAAPRDYRHDDFQKMATCPGSNARQHTTAQSTITFDNACEDVTAEMVARASGEGGWQDPHNRGNYEVLLNYNNMLRVKRRTGNNRYTDIITFAMTSSGDGCVVNACSESQGNSNNDAGTNMCNMANLYCNSNEQADNGVACKSLKTELTYTASTECGRYRGDGRYREHDCQPLANTCLVQPPVASLGSSVVLAAPRDYRHNDFQLMATCAPSGARQHTMAQSTITFQNSCADVSAEMTARASGEGGWQDPHNRGNYEVLSSDATMLKVKRRTGNNRYTDVITFAMQSTGADTCQVNACSVSQGNSNNDAGTNMCNMANLYCNSKTQADNGVACKPVNTELTYVAQTECGRYRGDRRYREHDCQPMANTCLKQPSLASMGPFHVLNYLLEGSQ